MQLRPLYASVCYPLLITIATAAFAIGAPCQAPTLPAPSPSFDVESIRMVDSNGMTKFPDFPASQFVAENMSLTILIAIAYNMSDDRIVDKPSWLDGTLYTVRAKPEDDAALTEEQYQPLLQDLLRRRFHLATHFETRQVSGYELVIAKSGAKLKPANEKGDAMAYILSNGLQCPNVTTTTLASLLARPVGHPVIDKTGLDGHYNIDLHFAPLNEPNSDLPDIFTALQEQLGLKLESKKFPQSILSSTISTKRRRKTDTYLKEGDEQVWASRKRTSAAKAGCI